LGKSTVLRTANIVAAVCDRRILLPLRHEMGERAGVRWCLGSMGRRYLSFIGAVRRRRSAGVRACECWHRPDAGPHSRIQSSMFDVRCSMFPTLAPRHRLIHFELFLEREHRTPKRESRNAPFTPREPPLHLQLSEIPGSAGVSPASCSQLDVRCSHKFNHALRMSERAGHPPSNPKKIIVALIKSERARLALTKSRASM
jgi:hypothetical protein